MEFIFEAMSAKQPRKRRKMIFLMGGGPSTLFDLVESGDKEAVQSLLTSQAADGTLDIDKRHPDFGYTALHFAAKGNYPEIAKMLFQYGSDVNAQNDYGYTPLHLAALWNSVEVGALLIDEHAYVNVGDEQGDRPLHIAIRENNVKFASILLEAGADHQAKEELGFSPIHFIKSKEMETMIIRVVQEGNQLHEGIFGGGREAKPLAITEKEDRGMPGYSNINFETVVLDGKEEEEEDDDDGIRLDDEYEPPIQSEDSPGEKENEGLFFLPGYKVDKKERRNEQRNESSEELAAQTLSSTATRKVHTLF